MREVSRVSGAVDTLRIAVLAALNLADETFQLRARGQEGEQLLRRRAASLAQELGSALED